MRQSVTSDCRGLQRPEGRLQESERTALTFASNHACDGLQRLAQIYKKPVPESKNPITTGLKNCLLSSRSMVRIDQRAFTSQQSRSDRKPRSGSYGLGSPPS